MPTASRPTPGPWYCSKENDGGYVRLGPAWRIHARKDSICLCVRGAPHHHAPYPADVRLMVAAPQLLAACQGARALFRPSDNLPVDIEANFRRMMLKCPELQAINAAIAAAIDEST